MMGMFKNSAKQTLDMLAPKTNYKILYYVLNMGAIIMTVYGLFGDNMLCKLGGLVYVLFVGVALFAGINSMD